MSKHPALIMPMSTTRAAVFTTRDVVKPKSRPAATPYVFGSPYRRVYQDQHGLFVTWFGQRKPVLLSDMVRG